MIRGTIAQFKFKLPHPRDSLEWITIKFWQPGNPSEFLPITKKKDNCSTTNNPNEICVSLSAEETARFSDKYKGKVQLRAQPALGASFGSLQQSFIVYPMRDDIINDESAKEPEIPKQSKWLILDGETVGVTNNSHESIVINGDTIG